MYASGFPLLFLAFRRLFSYVCTMFEKGDENLVAAVGVVGGEGTISNEPDNGRQSHSKLTKLLSRERLPKIFKLVLGNPLQTQEIKDYLEECPSCVNEIEDRGKDTVLHRLVEVINEHDPVVAIEHKNLLECLLQKGANTASKNINGETPLHIAAKNNRYKTMQLLIQSKPEDKNTILNEKNNEGSTCLHTAVHNKSVEVVAILHRYANYLDEDLTNKQGFTANEIAQKIMFNDNKLAMEKISNILESDQLKYEEGKEYLNYLKEISSEELWSLRPVTKYNTTVYGGEPTIYNNSTVNIA